jgi:dienelactone hydrolase
LLSAAPGPFPVGHTTLRVDADASGPALNVHVWYPSSVASAAQMTYEIFPGVELASRLAMPDPPAGEGRFPLIVYSHGSGGFGLVATFFTEVLASHGYVVAAPDHPGDTVVDAFLRQQAGGSLDLVRAVRNRVVDLGRVLDALTEAASTGGSGVLAGVVDTDRVVLAGHSLGGAGALDAAARLRADAVIVMDPTLTTVSAPELARIEVPVLVMTGRAWVGQPEPFELRTAGPWYRVAIPTAPHDSFTDVCDYQADLATWLAAGAPAPLGPYIESLVAESCVPPAIAPARLRALVDGYSLAFVRWVLDDDPTWTELVDQAQPDATIEQRPS